MITDRPEFLVREYVLLVERPNPLTHLHYILDFCSFPGRSLIPPTSPKRGGRVRASFFGTVTGKRAYADTYPQSLAPKMYEESPRHREVTHGPCQCDVPIWATLK